MTIARRNVSFRVLCACIGAAVVGGCKPPAPSAAAHIAVSARATAIAPVDSTKEMADLLQSIASSVDPRDMQILVNDKHADILRDEISHTTDPAQLIHLRLRHAVEMLNSGKTQDCLNELGSLEKDATQLDAALWSSEKQTVMGWTALAYLRLGEQQNCCAANTADSCLLPIAGAGVHTKTSGSTRAMEEYEAMLREHPDDIEARWLLNISAMTLGKYPEGVPAAWRISPSVFKSEYAMKKFPNVAPAIGLGLLGLSGGCVVDDLDGDGNLDIMISGIGFQDQMRLFHNNADGTFSERTKEAGLTGEMGGLNLIQADYNNSGHPSVLVLRGGWMGKAGRFPFSLLRNNGDGTFTDVTKQAGLLRYAPTQTAVWLDYNNDGLLDLFVSFESGTSGSYPCALFRNNGDGTFTDVAVQAGVDFTGFVKAAVSADYDNDGYPDLYLSIGGRATADNVLFHNNRDGTFTNVADKAGVTAPHHSFSSFWFDYDNDGWPDLFVIGYCVDGLNDVVADYLGMPSTAERSRLYHNNRDGTFTDVTKDAHLNKVILGMGINYGDLDNDGYLDFYVGTGDPNLNMVIPNRMFRNAGGKYFQEVTTACDVGDLQKGHAIAFADINNDGSQDIFEQMGGAAQGDIAYSTLFANPGNSNHWITLKLEGVRTNRSAIGARIKVTVNTPAGSRSIYKTVSSGGSFGAGPLRQEIGLGNALSIEKVEIFWPVSRKTQTLSGVAMDHFYSIREDKDAAVMMKLKTFRWPGM